MKNGYTEGLDKGIQLMINATACLLFVLMLVFLSGMAWAGESRVLTTVAGSGPTGYSNGGYAGDGGPAVDARLYHPTKIALDPQGNMFFIDFFNRCIRKVDVTSNPPVITTVAGRGGLSTAAPFTWVSATNIRLYSPDDIAVDSAGNVYVSDYQNNLVWKVDTQTSLATVCAGDRTRLNFRDGVKGPYSSVRGPKGLSVDASGNLYICENGGNCIRKVNGETGIITTVAGNGSAAGPFLSGAPANAASVPWPKDVSCGQDNCLYITDASGFGIRKVDLSTGIISTVGPAPSGTFSLCVDAAGNIFLAGGNRIYMRDDLSGQVTCIVGNGVYGYSPDGTAAASASLALASEPGVAVDTQNNIFIPDSSNNRVRKVALAAQLPNCPENVAATTEGAGGKAQVRVGWSSPSDVSGIAGYKVFRNDVTSGPVADVGEDGRNLYEFMDTSVSDSREYCYRVVSYRSCGTESEDCASDCEKVPLMVTASVMAGRCGGTYNLGSALPIEVTLTRNGVPVGPDSIGSPVPRLYQSTGSGPVEVTTKVIGSGGGLFRYVGGGTWKLNLKTKDANGSGLAPGNYVLVVEPNAAGSKLGDSIMFSPAPTCSFTLVDKGKPAKAVKAK